MCNMYMDLNFSLRAPTYMKNALLKAAFNHTTRYDISNRRWELVCAFARNDEHYTVGMERLLHFYLLLTHESLHGQTP